MRLSIALVKLLLRIASALGVGLIVTLAIARILPPKTALTLIQRISAAVGTFFLIDLIQSRVSAHVNETVDTLAETAGIHVTPHPLDNFV